MPGANRLLANPGLLQSRGCFGCCAKPTPITAVDEPSKRLRIQGHTIRKASLSEDFWSSSAHEMENSAIQSQRSMSSISTAAQSNDQHATGSSSNPNQFVNQGKNSSVSLPFSSSCSYNFIIHVSCSGTRLGSSGLETKNTTLDLNSLENRN
ncbi:hypothetical protein PR202_gb27848 [Eleusine coracana subsp. coracana]|uniref:Uncharacterized protein n=1 Tax=Eleusine coracana subsp. coracana TaxID=191504 RepID=A0AAV5FUV0_ELECO|nr:hypothetical protein PR202_gb27848 [Eleusine coracana subsp. coracana]